MSGKKTIRFGVPPGFGVRQSSAAFRSAEEGVRLFSFTRERRKSGRGLPHSKTLARYLATAVILSFSLVPRFAQAHGELLIRIAAASRVIATNATAEGYLNRGELYRQDQNWEAAGADYAQAAKL